MWHDRDCMLSRLTDTVSPEGSGLPLTIKRASRISKVYTVRASSHCFTEICRVAMRALRYRLPKSDLTHHREHTQDDYSQRMRLETPLLTPVKGPLAPHADLPAPGLSAQRHLPRAR
jgi:hypothetical protein